jgi:hypothetical protein
MTGMMRVPRSRGAFCGLLLILLGAWGGLIPFIGPHFHYAYTPDTSWTYTSGRLLLEVLPGAGAVLGGLIVLASHNRPTAMFGAWLAALSGAWFAVGGVLSTLWTSNGLSAAGTPVGGTAARVAEQVGFFTGLGIVIAFLAALAMGRFAVVGVRETRIMAREQEIREQELAAEEEAAVPATVSTPATVTTPATDEAAETVATPATVTRPATVSTPATTRTPAEVSPEAAADDDAVTADEAGVPDDDASPAEPDTETPGKVKVTS